MTPETISIEDILNSINDNSVLPSPVDYQYWYNLQNRKIIINDAISDTIIETAVLPYMQMNVEGQGAVDIYINTGGGEVYNGFALINAIENAKVPTTIHILATAFSMGLLIAMAGHNNPNVKTVCSPFSVGLLHSGQQYMEGATHAVKDTFNFSQAYEEKIKNYTLSHSLIDEKFYDKIERMEYWMDADEMLRLGIVDEIK